MCSPVQNSCSPHGRNSGMCGCGGGFSFMSRKKKIESLERYRDCLKEKLDDVEESIKELNE